MSRELGEGSDVAANLADSVKMMSRVKYDKKHIDIETREVLRVCC